MNIHFISLGCPKNLVDSESVMGGLAGPDVCFVDEPKLADAIIINTCGFIEDAKMESIETIFSAVHLKRRGKCLHLLVMGCLSERYKTELRQKIPEIDGFWGARGIDKFPDEIMVKLGLSKQPSTRGKRLITTQPVYSYVKIAEGCDNYCSFCAIPSIRGPHKSRAEENILDEVKWLTKQGIKELILISQDTTYYGQDLNSGVSLVSLLHKIEMIKDLHWLRVMYLYPERITDDLIEVIARSDKICHYLDLPLQHISADILPRMGRRISKKAIKDLIEKLRTKIPNLAIRTSFIVGFPGETEKNFEELLDFVRETKFERLGVFQFSAEEGTEAANFKNQIPEDIKKNRMDVLLETQLDISLANNQKLINKNIEVLIDCKNNGDGKAIGRTRWDAPEIDQTVHINANLEPGNLVSATVLEASEFDLYCRLNRLN